MIPFADILFKTNLNDIYINPIIKDWAIICWQLFICQSLQFYTNLTNKLITPFLFSLNRYMKIIAL